MENTSWSKKSIWGSTVERYQIISYFPDKSDKTLCQIFPSVRRLFQNYLSHLQETSVLLLWYRGSVAKYLELVWLELSKMNSILYSYCQLFDRIEITFCFTYWISGVNVAFHETNSILSELAPETAFLLIVYQHMPRHFQKYFYLVSSLTFSEGVSIFFFQLFLTYFWGNNILNIIFQWIHVFTLWKFDFGRLPDNYACILNRTGENKMEKLMGWHKDWKIIAHTMGKTDLTWGKLF